MTFKLVIGAAAMLALTGLSCQSASAFSRSTTVTTASGTYQRSVDASCAGGVCSGSSQFTGPHGNTVTRSGSCTGGWRYYSCTGTVTGPKGNSLTRHVVGRRYYW